MEAENISKLITNIIPIVKLNLSSESIKIDQIFNVGGISIEYINIIIMIIITIIIIIIIP
jgi:hypothetical protein